MALANSNYSSSLVEPSSLYHGWGCCKPCLCPSCRGVNVINEVGGQEILALQGLSSAQLDLVVFPLTALTWCWPVGSIAVDADLVKPALQLTSQCSIKEDQGDSVCTGLGGCNSAIRFSLCDRKQRYWVWNDSRIKHFEINANCIFAKECQWHHWKFLTNVFNFISSLHLILLVLIFPDF